MITAAERESICEALGPEGIGAAHIPGFLNVDEVNVLASGFATIPWRRANRSYQNQRGLHIEQRYDEFALRTDGDQAAFVQFPFMADLSRRLTEFVGTFSDVFPVLETWQAREVSTHRYLDTELGLTRHRDNARFYGVIGQLTITGLCDTAIYPGPQLIQAHPGDLILLRATHLTGDPEDESYRVMSNPEHAVLAVHHVPRISLIVRDTLRPTEAPPGFTYDNWPPTT